MENQVQKVTHNGVSLFFSPDKAALENALHEEFLSQVAAKQAAAKNAKNAKSDGTKNASEITFVSDPISGGKWDGQQVGAVFTHGQNVNAQSATISNYLLLNGLIAAALAFTEWVQTGREVDLSEGLTLSGDAPHIQEGKGYAVYFTRQGGNLTVLGVIESTKAENLANGGTAKETAEEAGDNGTRKGKSKS